MVTLKGVVNGGLFAGGRMFPVNMRGATCEQRFVRFLGSENSRNRNANGAPVKSLPKAVLTLSSTSTKLYKQQKKDGVVTFKQQASRWLERLRARKRKPVSTGTIDDWERILNK